MNSFTAHPSTAFSRRGFLTRSGAAAALLAAPGGWSAGSPHSGLHAAEPAAPRRWKVGIELYSVRTELARDLPGTLRAVAKMGYEAVEFYSPYFNWSFPHAKEVRSQLDDLGLRCLSTHNPMEALTPGETMAKSIELNQILGARQIVLASAPGGTEGEDGWKKLAGRLSVAVEQLQPHGLFAGFHNHASEWAKLPSGARIMDVLAAGTPPEFILQLDVGTCVEAGADPVAWIKSHPGRVRSVHLKDWAPGEAAQEKGFRVLFGEGASPWKDIVAALESVGGVEVYLLEQEGSRFSEMETAQRCLEAWRSFRSKA